MRIIDWLKGFRDSTTRTQMKRSIRKSHYYHSSYQERCQVESLESRLLLTAQVDVEGWQAISAIPQPEPGQVSYLRSDDFAAYRLNVAELSSILATAPMEFTNAAPIEILVPDPNGGFARFAVVNSPIMAPELAAEFPEINTYGGQGIDDPAATIRIDVTPAGFHAQVLSPNGAYYVDPYFHLNTEFYASYFGSSLDASGLTFDESLEESVQADQQAGSGTVAGKNPNSVGAGDSSAPVQTAQRSGTQLRTYRTAVAATGEYVAFQGGTVPLGQAAIVTAINRVSGIYETELSIRLQLIAGNSALVYTNASTDPYSNSNASALLTQNQSNIDNVIGSANYDIGHVFTTGGGGLAGLGVVGNNARKAQGETGLSAPIGDAFYVDYVAHEMGHQFGGNHTFNGVDGAAGGNQNSTTSYEPGSGTTIQAYAGICGTDDLQAHSDPYFHSVSFDEIINYVDNVIPSVGTRIATGNSVPTVEAGSNYVIPAQTPFALTAVGSDGNASDVLTYSWEERDLGPFVSVLAGDNGSSPIFRAFSPTTSPTRSFPRLSDLLNNTTVIGETLPTTTRKMDFRVTVRDNRTGGGGVNTDDMRVNVVNTGAAFAVTSPNTAVSLTALTSQTVTWNVAGTTGNGINTPFVNILLSTDGGNTYSTVLASGVPNDGSQAVVLPNTATTQARIRVEGAGNIFFDISNVNFTITLNPNTMDFGDAPDPSYATLLANNGARHIIGGPTLGFGLPDSEANGQPNATATGDGSDEDGISLTDPLVAGSTTQLQVKSSAGGGVLNYFFDFDGNGVFGNNPNEIFTQTLSGGTERVPVTIPAGISGTVNSRFRISTTGGLTSVGQAPNGEVEDYQFNVFATQPDLDFGDSPSFGYPTIAADDGARHLPVGPTLGVNRDAEADAQSDFTATGDGLDEDGVIFPQIFQPGGLIPVQITSSVGGGELNAFFDWNRNGIWGDVGNEIVSATLTGGTQIINVSVPSNVSTGVSDARFRISVAGGLGPTGFSPDGEVEDYQIRVDDPTTTVNFQNFDGVSTPALPSGWVNSASGSAPQNWNTVGGVNSDSAANHAFVVDPGNTSDSRLTSPTVVPTLPRLKFRNNYATESTFDGGVLEISINGGAFADIITAGGSFVTGGYNGSIDNTAVSAIAGRPAWTGSSGGYIDTVVALPGSALNQNVQFRWRFVSDDSAGSTGWRIDTIQFQNNSTYTFDYGDAPDPTYPTTVANSGASHAQGFSTLFLGSSVDTESDGLANSTATGDDQVGADEDGVTLPGSAAQSEPINITVNASAVGILNAWIDFNNDGDWNDAGEQIAHDRPMSIGDNTLAVVIPPTAAVTSQTFARFRLSSNAGQAPDGRAPDGEVEDYALAITQGTPTVNLSVSDNVGSEAGTTVITVSAIVGTAVTSNQFVTLGVTGSGITALDYLLSNTTVVIPNGSTTGSVTFTIQNDALVESTEVATLSIVNASAALILGNVLSQNVTITDNDSATVSIAPVNDGAETNSPTNGKFRVTQTAASSSATTITYSIAGTAVPGVDYTPLTGSVTIPAGQTTADIDVVVLNDNNVNGTQTVILTLLGFTAHDPEITLDPDAPDRTATINITDDDTATTLLSIARLNPLSSDTNADTLIFRATFNRTVTNADASDFRVTGTTATITGFNAVSGTQYDITVSGGDLANLNGIVGLDVASGQNIVDLAGSPLLNVEPAIDQTYTVDNTAPNALSFVRQTPSSSLTNADTLVFRVTFDEPVTGVDLSDFVGNGTTATVSVAQVNPSTYDVTLTGGNLANLNGIVGLNFNSPGITDLAGNALGGAEPATDQTYQVDNTQPTAVSFVRRTPLTSPTNADTLVFRVTFSDPVTGVGAADFIASGTTAGVNVSAVSTTVYDVTLSGGNLANLNGTVGLNFNVPIINDLAGNALPNSEPTIDETFLVDNTPPTVLSFTRQNPLTDPTAADALVFRATFSQAVTSVDAADFAVTGTTATVTAVTAVSGSNGTQYDVTVLGGDLPNLTGVVGLDLSASQNIFDLAGNLLTTAEPATDETYVVINSDPSVAAIIRLTPSGSSTNADSLVFQVIFSEPVTGVDNADFASHGTTATLNVAPVTQTIYNVTVTGGNLAGLNGLVGLDLAAAPTIVDLSANALPATEPVIDEEYLVDNISPTLVVTPNGTTTNDNPVVFQFTFSDPVIGFDASDVNVTNGTKGLFTTVDGATYTLQVTPNTDGLVSVSVGANAATDLATNGNSAANASITSDLTDPTIIISPNSGLTNAAPITFTFQFSEVVTDFAANDINVTNGMKGTFVALDGDTYTLEVTPTADGTVSVNVAADSAMDLVTNGNAAASASVISDRTAPTLGITPNGTLTNAVFTIFTFQFSEAVTGFDVNDVNLVNATSGTFTAVDSDTYTLQVFPSADGMVSVSVNANSAIDSASNGNTSASTAITSDQTSPTLNITPNGIATNAFSTIFTFQFGESVTGFSASDISVSNGTKGLFTTIDSDTYTLVVNLVADGPVTVNVGANSAFDAATNGNLAASAVITSDRTAPTLSITPKGILTNQPSTTFTFQFSTPVINFDVSDINLTNGTAGVFTAVDSDTYTLIVTPIADGTVTASVSTGAATDDALNGNTSASASITSDLTAPTLVITPNGTVTNAGSATFTFQFSEPVSGFDVSDVTVTNGTLGTFKVVDADTYTLIVALSAEGTVSVDVGANAASDAATNGNLASSASITNDRTNPTLIITPDGIPTNATSTLFTFQFSEIVTGFAATDITVTNGTKGAFTTVDGQTYTLLVTPIGGGNVAVIVNSNVATDAASNGNIGASATITVDRISPTLNITPNNRLTNADSTTFTFQFSERVFGFDASDINVTNGVKGLFTAIDGDTYTLDVASVADGTISINVADAAATDAAQNPSILAAASITSDRTAPTLVITPDGTLTNASSVTFTFQFSEVVTGFSASDIIVTNGAKSAFTTVDGDTYRLIVVPVANGTATISVNANAANDSALNGNTAASASIISDHTAPTVDITPKGTLTNADSVLFTILFSEPVTGFDLSDVQLTNGTPGLFTAVDANTYTLAVSPIANGTVSVAVSGNAAIDAATNPSLPGSASITSDRIAPSLSITPNGTLTNAATTTFIFQFSEGVLDFDASDVNVTNGTIGTFTAVDADTYKLVVTPIVDGTVTVAVNASVATDLASNPNSAATASITSDRTAPTLSIVPDGILTNAASSTFTFQFSEDVTGFTNSDVVVTNGTKGLFTTIDARTYTLVVNHIADGNVLVSVNSGGAIDAALNSNTAATASVVVDRTAPRLNITPNGTLTNADTITFTFQFTEAVTGFDASGISITNGIAGNFTAVDSDTYTLDVTPISDGTVSARVNANVAQDAASNGNTAASASITSDRTVPTLNIIPDTRLTNTLTTTFLFQFSETITGFTASDVIVANGTKGAFTMVNPSAYILVVAPSSDGPVTVSVNANAATDAAGNGNTAASTSIISDRTGPTLGITPGGTLTNASATTFTFQFNEPVTGFDASDINVFNGLKGALTAVDEDTYTLAVTPIADGPVTVSVNGNSAFDAAINGNQFATTTITTDRTAPALSISPTGTLTNAGQLTFTFQFTEPVTGFSASDINVTNGTPGAFVAVDGDTYTLAVTPIADGTVSVAVNANAASDNATNGNTASAASVSSDRSAPVFTTTSTPSVPENSIGVLSVAATDAHGPVKFAIQGGTDAALFSIDSNSGALRFIQSPDFEAPSDSDFNNDYQLRISATDALGQTSTQDVTVSVTPVNDNSPAFTSSPNFSITENFTAVGNLFATDADRPAQAVTFSITGGADAALFTVTPAGSLVFVNAPDFENPNDAGADHVYNVTITASDNSFPTHLTSQNILIQVLNDNEAPSDIDLSNSTVKDRQPVGTAVGTFTTSDPDTAGTFTYSFVAGGGDSDNALFRIVGNTLQTNSVFNFAKQPTRSVRIRSTDAGGLSTEKAFTIGLIQTITHLLELDPNPVTWTNHTPPITVVPQINVIKGADYTGGTLTLSFVTVGTKKKALDQLLLPAVQFGTSNEVSQTPTLTSVTVQLGAADTANAIQSFLRGITFSTKGKGIRTLTRTLDVTLTDADGLTTSVSRTINVHKKAN